MNSIKDKSTDGYSFYWYYLYTRMSRDDHYSVALYRHFEEVISKHPAQCCLNGQQYPAQWYATTSEAEVWAIQVLLDGNYCWLADKYQKTVEVITHVSVRVANTDEKHNEFFVYISDRMGTVEIEVYRSLDDAILAHLPPTNYETACWDSRGKDRWEISLGKVWAHDKLDGTQIIAKATLGNLVQVNR